MSLFHHHHLLRFRKSFHHQLIKINPSLHLDMYIDKFNQYLILKEKHLLMSIPCNYFFFILIDSLLEILSINLKVFSSSISNLTFSVILSPVIVTFPKGRLLLLPLIS